MFGNMSGGVSQQCKFGLPSLDEALGGGIFRGQTWLIEDEIGSDYDPLIMSFLANGLQSMDYIYLLSTEHAFDYYKKQFQNFGRNPAMEIKTGRLKFVDGFSGSYQVGLSPGSFGTGGYSGSGGVAEVGGLDQDDNEGIEVLEDITQPREINEAIRRSLLHVQEGPTTGIRGACLTLSSIIHAASDQKDIFQFIQNRRAMDALKNSTTLLTIHADAHDPLLIRAIEHQVDGVLRIQRDKQSPDPNDPLHIVKIINARGKAELTGREVKFKFTSGRITPV
jgi:KaiC/GvpD/RAD55 family RecA-like ATPase